MYIIAKCVLLISLKQINRIFIVSLKINPVDVKPLLIYKIHADTNKMVAIPFASIECDRSINIWPKDIGWKYFGYFNILDVSTLYFNMPYRHVPCIGGILSSCSQS